MNPYLKFVEEIEHATKAAKGLSVSGSAEVIESSSKVLLFSPHPDDECITGLLPLRLMRELGKEIINIPITFGSNHDRRSERSRELKNACEYLGWKNTPASDNFDPLDVDSIVSILKQYQPEIIFFPHAGDWNSRHISTHFLVMEALVNMPSDFSCIVVETEYWGAMDDPNLMVEADSKMLADLISALSMHTGEVERNPYHLSLPAWMQDNVRRGGELVGGQGNESPAFSFATLYRIRKWKKAQLAHQLEKGAFVPTGIKSLKGIF